jgi:raffinose/stachyose/melibiose transport system substrate-binding protein
MLGCLQGESMPYRFRTLIRTAAALLVLVATHANAGTLTIESWRVDDKAAWEKVLIPAFEKRNPGIHVRFSPTSPTEYDSSLASRLTGGTAGDLIACRPFDVSLSLYRHGHLDRLNGVSGMENFPDQSTLAWRSDDGADVYCMPVASVIHGFLYNKKVFKRLHLQPPHTQAEFLADLESIRKEGKVQPLDIGTADQWESNQILFTNVGPNFWHGETGRRALIDGNRKFTDAEFVGALDFLSKLHPYLGQGASSQTYADSQNLFSLERAAVYPTGSWDLAYFGRTPSLELGVFAPPVEHAGDKCFISDHMDMGIGVNRHGKNKADAMTFLAWIGSQEFADLYSNQMVGFFTLSNHLIAVRNALAQQMLQWRQSCSSTIRLNSQFLNRGQPSLENELWNVDAQILNGRLSAADGAARLQNGLNKWYHPNHKQ